MALLATASVAPARGLALSFERSIKRRVVWASELVVNSSFMSYTARGILYLSVVCVGDLEGHPHADALAPSHVIYSHGILLERAQPPIRMEGRPCDRVLKRASVRRVSSTAASRCGRGAAST